MSGVEPVQETPTVEAVFGGPQPTPVEELDTGDGTPSEPMDLDAGDDGALASSEAGETESDTDDGTPEDEESGEAVYEQRYKDLQAEFTAKTQELADLKAEYAGQAGEITQAKFDLGDKFAEAEQALTFVSNMAMGELQNLQRVNPQQLSQEQFAEYQQRMGAAQARASQMQQALSQVQEQAKQAKEAAIQREVAISRAQLVKSIDNFDEAYPEIGKFAVSEGVNPNVFKEITDPGLIKIIHRAMQVSKAPDTIKEVSRKGTTQRRQPRSADGKFAGQAKPKSLAEKMYGST